MPAKNGEVLSISCPPVSGSFIPRSFRRAGRPELIGAWPLHAGAATPRALRQRVAARLHRAQHPGALERVRKDLNALRRAVLEAPDVDDRELGGVAVLLDARVPERHDGVPVADQLVDLELELVPGADRLLQRLHRLIAALVLTRPGQLG